MEETKIGERKSLDEQTDVKSLDEQTDVISLDNVEQTDVESLKLTLSVNDTINVDVDKAKIKNFSKMIDNALTSDSTNIMYLSNTEVNEKSLSLIAKYIELHDSPPEKIKSPLSSANMTDVTNKNDAEFIDEVGKDREQLFNLIKSANYLMMDSLLHLCCAKVASLIKGKQLDEIKEILGMKKEEEKKD